MYLHTYVHNINKLAQYSPVFLIIETVATPGSPIVCPLLIELIETLTSSYSLVKSSSLIIMISNGIVVNRARNVTLYSSQCMMLQEVILIIIYNNQYRFL